MKTARGLLTLLVVKAVLAGCSVQTSDPNKFKGSSSKSSSNSSGKSGDQTGANEEGGASGEGDQISGSDTGSGSGDAADPTLSLTYEKTVYPIIEERCASCHTTLAAPFFGVKDIKKSEDTVITTEKVNFKNTGKSRLVQRLNVDRHNCWNECEADAKEMNEAIDKWLSYLNKNNSDTLGPQHPTSTSLPMTMAVDGTREAPPLPPGVMMIEAETATFKAPMVAVDDATRSGGKYVWTPAGAGRVTQVNQAANNNTLGTVTYTVNITQAGNYRMMGLVSAATANNNGFFIKVDAGNYLLWRFAPTGAEWVWDIADPVDAMGTAHLFNLTAGSHTIEIRQSEEQAKLDRLVLAMDQTFDPTTVTDGATNVKLLKYDLSSLVKVDGVFFVVEVEDFDNVSYRFSHPRIETASKSIHVKNLKLMVNDVFYPQNATYTIIDSTVKAPGGLLSKASLVALKDKGPDYDQFSFSFDVLEVVNAP